jgi:hypothetical protein
MPQPQESGPSTHQTLLTLPDGGSVSLQQAPTPEDCAALWSIIQNGFVDLNRKSYEKQDMTEEEFNADMQSSDVLKYVAYDADQNPIGCLTAHIGLEDITWMDKAFLAAEQERVDPTATPYYVGTLVVPQDVRGTGVSRNILQAAYLDFTRRNAETGQSSVCFFDCADANYPWLAQFVEKSAEPSEVDGFAGVTIDMREIGQEYWIRPTASPEANPVKVRSLPENSTDVSILDKQHIYAYNLVSSQPQPEQPVS